MKRREALLALAIVCAVLSAGSKADPRWKEGDILFQTSRSAQSQAIQDATRSHWSHTGLLLRKDGRWMVLEAVGPVKYTPVESWIRRGERGHVVARRLKAKVHALTPADLTKVRQEGERLLGLPYDRTFEWDDRRIYCSELVWKVFDRALGVKLGKLQRLRDFNLGSPAVKEQMVERYHGQLPLDEPVISPEALYEAPELESAWSR